MCAAAVNTMRGAIAQAGSRIWFVTCGAQPAGKTAAPNAEQAALWGLGRTIALEQPDTWGGLLDLDPQDGPEQQAQWVIEATHRTGREDQLVIRDGVCLAARLARMPLCPPSNFSVKPDGSCLVTGAFGGLGPRIARWLVDRGARHLVLVSRRGLPDRSSWAAQDPAGDIGQSIAAVQAMEALGVTVESVAADVAVRSQMEDLFSRFGREWPPLRGMIHAAVAATIVPVCELGNTEFLRMFSAKVTGGHHLLELGSKQPLDFVVLFSSLAGVVGSSGGAHYSAASTCLDALAHVGRSQGLPVTAISWGSWEVMRNSTEDIRKRFRAGGLIPMPFERALNIMGMVLASGVPEIIVAPVDWKAFRTIHELRRPRPLLSNMGTDAAPAAPAPETPRQNTKLRQRLSAAAAQERPQIVRQEVRQAIAHVLRIKNPDTIDGQKPLLEMGMDSLMAIELISIIRRQFAIDLPLESLFNIATVERLADKVAELLRATETPITEPTAPHTATERRLASIWEALLQRGPIGINDRFFELNGSSALRERMLAEVRRAFGVAAEGIPINALADGLTIHALARLIDESLETTSSLLVPLQTRGSRIPLFLIHAGGGYVFFYRALASRLAPDQPLYAIRAETPDDGLGRPFEQTRSIEELAARYITEIRKVSPNGPYLLGGACFGGVMAFEMAKQLQAAGEEVGPVLLFDSFVLNNKLTYSQRIARQIHYLSGRPIREVVWYAGAKTARRILPSSLLNAARALRTGPRAPLPDPPPQMTTPQWAMAQHGLPEKQRQAFETCMQTATRLLVAYKPRVYDGKIVLFKAAQSDDPVPYWTNLGREGMVIHAIPGGHLDMMEEPAVEMTASLVREHAGVQQRPSMVASLACAS
jgi:thioesterase domain-containing protein/NAD(P)-dependent dehydrogenase (short-subunit alcohol dehydrogenase family)/acyl carrier protein